MFHIFREQHFFEKKLDIIHIKNPVEALAEYKRLCQYRTEVPGCVIMLDDSIQIRIQPEALIMYDGSIQIGYSRTDMSWPNLAREQREEGHYIYALEKNVE